MVLFSIFTIPLYIVSLLFCDINFIICDIISTIYDWICWLPCLSYSLCNQEIFLVSQLVKIMVAHSLKKDICKIFWFSKQLRFDWQEIIIIEIFVLNRDQISLFIHKLLCLRLLRRIQRFHKWRRWVERLLHLRFKARD